ncbi:MAG: hypothetical protein H7A01_15065 [Hahellaceae bacterium]|nr:hypothetical protein [Hahellaceae bacterium]MCP5210378.1 hypothetical protein [Hahellaceae bacterium]
MSRQFRKSALTLFLASALLSACGGGGGGGSDASTPTNPATPNDPGQDTSTDAVYSAGTAASLTTTEESFDAASETGESIGILLGDGSSAMIPELTEAFEMTLARNNTSVTDTINAEAFIGLVPTGATRELTFYGNGDLSALKPVITIPAAEAGTINLDTVNVMRIGDIYIDGELVRNQATMLPVAVNDEGALSFVDPLMRDALQQTSTILNTTSAQDKKQLPSTNVTIKAAQNYEWVGSAKYVLMSFQDDLNWNRAPKLVRMIPDMESEDTGYRRPATESELVELNKQAICNMVLLVHGHNEQEKEGTYDTTAEAPWLFEYKRLVWDLFYREIMAEEREQPIYPYQCTAFYEYIFPTYRAVYSPVSDKNGQRHETLGESLGRLVKEEFTNNAQLKGMQDNDMQYNVVVVAHSQGGLVARSGFRHMPDNFKSHISRFISWGTPHHGAALVSLRYALQAGHDMIIDGKRLPLHLVGKNFVSDWALNKEVALDAPGTRDLRWDAAKKDKINLRGIFPSITDANEGDIYPALYNDNLASFNDVIQSELAGLATPYTFFYGTTPKTAELELVDVKGGWWGQYVKEQAYKFTQATSIEQGAALNRLLMASGYQNSDGAVPVYSQQGAGIYGPETDAHSDVDHEEFYGAESPQRNNATIYKGVLTAQRTYDKAELTDESRSCPTVDATVEAGANDISFTGKVNFPIYTAKKKSLGQSIDRIEARKGSQSGETLSGVVFSHTSDGSFTGEGANTGISTGKIAVVAILKDGSEVATLVDYTGAAPYRWKESIFTDSEKTWTQTTSQDGKLVATTVWDERISSQETERHECELSIDWTIPAAQDAPLEMTIKLKEVRNGSVYFDPYFSVNLISYNGPLHEQSNGSYIARYGDKVNPNTTASRANNIRTATLSFLADTQTTSETYYDRTPRIYLELGLMCGSSEETWINLDYTVDD